MSKHENLISEIKEWATEFGAVNKENCIFRNNTSDKAYHEGGAYFGYIRNGEGETGPFHDFSFTVFPDKEDGAWVVAFGIGSLGFRNDYELAATPGVRRKFLKTISNTGFCKTSFLDIESLLPKEFIDNVNHLEKSLMKYRKVLPACEIVTDPYSKDGKSIIKGYLALYADFREWQRNNNQRKAVTDAINSISNIQEIDEESEVRELLARRKYIVLQGPPGTGKTRLAKKIASDDDSKVLFTQFHAETTYSDFVNGIIPAVNEDKLLYKEYNGILINAINEANEEANSDKKVYLIIDEINRANLSNVLGPVFYLFEHKMADDNVKIRLSNDMIINKMPDNLYVIGTMNTADRSIAVVDFALRRRFAWYSMNPRIITDDLHDNDFYADDFKAVANIFERYASDEELNLQPGQGYFIASSDEEMEDRIRYELMPLVKEYFAEGLILSARDRFSKYFLERIGEVMFK